MKKIVMVIILILSAKISFSQISFEFQPLRISDTVKNQNIIDAIEVRDEINSTAFLTEKYDEREGLFLFQKKDSVWIVYDYNDYVSNYVVSKHKNIDKNHVSVEVSVSRSGSGINSYSWFILFNLENNTYLYFSKSAYNESYQQETVIKRCESNIIIKKNILVVNMKCGSATREYCNFCLSSGTYKIQDNYLVKL